MSLSKFICALLAVCAAVLPISCRQLSESGKEEVEPEEEILEIGSISDIDSTLTSYEALSGYVSGLDGFLYDDSLVSDEYRMLGGLLDDFNVPVAPEGEIDSLAQIFHHAKVLMDSIIVLDSHCDFPKRAYGMRPYCIDDRQSKCEVSIEKMDQGHASAQCMALWMKPKADDLTSFEACAEESERLMPFLDFIEKHFTERPDVCGIARNREEILSLKKQGKKAFLLALENGYFAGNDISIIKELADRGVVYITLCHNGDNRICSSAIKSRNPSGGLTEYGKEFVREMNRQGILVDLSHTSPRTWKDVLELSSVPVVFTHSGASALFNSRRNVDDETLRLLSEKGGVIQVFMIKRYINKDENGKVHLDEMVRHINHCVQVAGIDHVGIGMDLDGGGGGVEYCGANDAIVLTMELIKEGYSDEDIRKIWGDNFLRVLSEAQAAAGR